MPAIRVSPKGAVALLYDAGAPAGDEAGRDVLAQMSAIGEALGQDGRKAERIGVTSDLSALKARLSALAPSLAFNLVESLDGSDRLQTIVPLLLEDWRVPFTGSGSRALLLSNHKIAAKRRLAELGLPTPECVWPAAAGRRGAIPDPDPAAAPGDWIVKAVEAHASFALDDASVARGLDAAAAAELAREMSARRGQAFFAERFVDGREFNLSLLENAAGRPEPLPAAEIRFDALPPGKPRLVGYAAKWQEDSAEYLGTPRSFDLPAADGPLTAELGRLALAAWRALGLAGYARVDFRVGADGRPRILEANANPCLAPDAGFAAAAGRAGIGYRELTRRITRAGLARQDE